MIDALLSLKDLFHVVLANHDGVVGIERLVQTHVVVKDLVGDGHEPSKGTLVANLIGLHPSVCEEQVLEVDKDR